MRKKRAEINRGKHGFFDRSVPERLKGLSRQCVRRSLTRQCPREGKCLAGRRFGSEDFPPTLVCSHGSFKSAAASAGTANATKTNEQRRRTSSELIMSRISCFSRGSPLTPRHLARFLSSPKPPNYTSMRKSTHCARTRSTLLLLLFQARAKQTHIYHVEGMSAIFIRVILRGGFKQRRDGCYSRGSGRIQMFRGPHRKALHVGRGSRLCARGIYRDRGNSATRITGRLFYNRLYVKTI